jgi:hypothetical protein
LVRKFSPIEFEDYPETRKPGMEIQKGGGNQLFRPKREPVLGDFGLSADWLSDIPTICEICGFNLTSL